MRSIINSWMFRKLDKFFVPVTNFGYIGIGTSAFACIVILVMMLLWGGCQDDCFVKLRLAMVICATSLSVFTLFVLLIAYCYFRKPHPLPTDVSCKKDIESNVDLS